MTKLIGTKDFYKRLFRIAIPIMIQNGISNFVNFLDNIMVGRVGTDQMSGVSIVNQLLFIFSLSIFGAISGAGIFSAQFFGQKNHEGVRNSFRFKLILCGVISVIGILILIFFDSSLISLYLHEGGETGNIDATMQFGKEYLEIMLIGLVPFAIVQCYAGTLRETGEAMVPMRAGIIAVLVNLFFNYLLIFGKWGFPVMGVRGAAIATVISRFVELAVVVIWTHRHAEINEFIKDAYKSFRIPASLVKSIAIKGTPLLLNEFLWAAGVAVMTQCYSTRGLAVVAGLNISSVIVNIFNVIFIATGSAVAIIVGQLLGANKYDEAKDTAYKLIFFSFASTVVIGALMFLTAPLFPEIYNTTDEVKALATSFIRITSFVFPIQATLHATYFTLRSGGKTLVTFLFDSGFMWAVAIPCAFVLSHYTALAILPIYIICQLIDIIKLAVGYRMLKKGVWVSNIVTEL